MVEVPELVRSKALVVGAQRWLDHLDDVVGELESDWGFRVGRPYAGGTEAFVARARLEDGAPVVLKVGIPRPGDAASHEITALRLADGRGCVRLLRDDVTREAMLLERLGPSLSDLALGYEERIRILVDLAAQVWQPAVGSGLPTGADKGRWLADFIATAWEQLDRPCSERAVDHALSCAERRIGLHDDERAVLVHGDVHQWNALRAGDAFKLVDPDGLLAEPEYDLGVLMREDTSELRPGHERDRAEWLAAETGLDATAIWEWGVVERVSTGLVCTQVDLQPAGREMLAVADRVASQGSTR